MRRTVEGVIHRIIVLSIVALFRWIMAFRVPNFNLVVNIWRRNGVAGVYALPDVVTAGNLSHGRRVMVSAFAGNSPMELLLPKLTDIRAVWNAVVYDVVEVPAGSQRFYQVTHVDDVAKGFANEYRLATIVYEPNGNPLIGVNSAPVPLP